MIEGQPIRTAEEVQKLQKAPDTDQNDSHDTSGAQPTSPHASCNLKKRDAGLVDALNQLSLEELQLFGLDKPFDESKLTTEIVDRLKALRLEKLAAPSGKQLASTGCSSIHLKALSALKLKGHVAYAGDHGSTLPESGVCKKEESLMDYWYDSEDAASVYDQESESECEQATDEVPRGEVEIAMDDWVDVVADVAEAPNGNASKPCIIN